MRVATNHWIRCLTIALLQFASVAATSGGEIVARRSDRGVAITIDGHPFCEYLTRSGAKPAVYPILGPGDVPLTRAYPLEDRAGEERDHVHHRSLWFTHGSVNDVDFWSEEPGHGTIEHREYLKIESGEQAVVATRNDWLAPDGRRLCQDERVLTFGGDQERRWIDFDIRLTASDGRVVFGETKEGAFGIRVASTMRVDAKLGGAIVNSDGLRDADAWGKAASYVDYFGPVNGQIMGIAVLNHPQSLRYPTRWHVRTYGLYAANPFGERSFTGDGDGAYALEPGKSASLHYRVLLHRGDAETAKIAEEFAKYAQVRKP